MRGGTQIKEARKEAKRRQEENSKNFEKMFMLLGDGESAVVRFLDNEENLVSAYVHSIKLPSRKMPVFIVCRDQDPETGRFNGDECPGCDSRDPQIARRSMRGSVNLIWRDAPIFQKDEENKFIKGSDGRYVVASREDQVAVWNFGPTVLDELITEGFETPGGLTGRDFKITRKGLLKETTYDIRPAERDGGQKPLSKADEELAANKYDLTKYETPPPLESWWSAVPSMGGQQQSSRPSFATQHVVADVSPFTNDDE